MCVCVCVCVDIFTDDGHGRAPSGPTSSASRRVHARWNNNTEVKWLENGKMKMESCRLCRGDGVDFPLKDYISMDVGRLSLIHGRQVEEREKRAWSSSSIWNCFGWRDWTGWFVKETAGQGQMQIRSICRSRQQRRRKSMSMQQHVAHLLAFRLWKIHRFLV